MNDYSAGETRSFFPSFISSAAEWRRFSHRSPRVVDDHVRAFACTHPARAGKVAYIINRRCLRSNEARQIVPVEWPLILSAEARNDEADDVRRREEARISKIRLVSFTFSV